MRYKIGVKYINDLQSTPTSTSLKHPTILMSRPKCKNTSICRKDGLRCRGRLSFPGVKVKVCGYIAGNKMLYKSFSKTKKAVKK